MKKTSFYILLVSCALCASLVLLLSNISQPVATSETAIPAMSVEPGGERKLHLGVVKAGETAKFLCRLVNTTPEDQRILRVGVSCGCVQVEQSPGVVKGNRTADMLCSFNVSNRHGVVEQLASVLTDSKDPTKTLYRFGVSASVQGAWSDPPSIDCGVLFVGDSSTKVCHLESLGHADVQLVSVTSDSEFVKATPLGPFKTVADRSRDFAKRLSIEVSCINPPSPRLINATLISEIDCGGIRTKVPTLVRFEAGSAIRCVPNSIVWTARASDSSQFAKVVRLQHRNMSDLDLHSLKLRCELQGLSAKLDLESEGQPTLNIEYATPEVGVERVAKGYVVGEIADEEVLRLQVMVVN